MGDCAQLKAATINWKKIIFHLFDKNGKHWQKNVTLILVSSELVIKLILLPNKGVY